MKTWRLLILFSAFVGCRHAAPAPSSPLVAITYEGDGALEGHFERPGAQRPFKLRLELSGNDTLWRLVQRTSAMGEEQVETVWVRGSEVRLERESVELLTGEAAARRRHLVLGVAAALGERRAPHVRRYGHPTFGDVDDRLTYGEAIEIQERRAAQSIQIEQHEQDVEWTAALTRVNAAPSTERLTMPPLTSSVPPKEDARVEIATVAPGVYTATIRSLETVSLVVEFSDHLAVLETSLTVAAGEAIVDTLAVRFPDKPIRAVFFGHHHPHYTGGLRAFMAAGAIVHAPSDNAKYSEAIAARAFTIVPDRLQALGVQPKTVPFERRVVLEDKTNRLEAIDIGAASNHTDEYVVFYLPKSSILFQGDLGWYLKDGEVRASRRARGLLDAIESHYLEVETLVQGWPVQPPLKMKAWRTAVSRSREPKK